MGCETVTYWALDRINEGVALLDQVNELKEDLAQVRLDEETLLDIGWYPEFSPEGLFVVTVVRREDWEAPLYRKEADTLDALRVAIKAGIDAANG